MSTLDRDPDDPAHAPVRSALAETGADLQPKAGWEAKVWERIDADAGASGGSARGGRRAVWLVGGGVLAAAAIALVVWRGGGGGRERDLVADARVEIRRSAQVVRSGGGALTAAPGDTAVVRHPAKAGVVWIYRGESTLVLVCDPARVADACRRDSAGVVAEVVLDRPGTYHVLTSVGTPSTAPASVDEARAMLTTAGVRFRHDELDVR